MDFWFEAPNYPFWFIFRCTFRIYTSRGRRITYNLPEDYTKSEVIERCAKIHLKLCKTISELNDSYSLQVEQSAFDSQKKKKLITLSTV